MEESRRRLVSVFQRKQSTHRTKTLRSRLAIVCFLMVLVFNLEACEVILNPYAINLPASKALWEARTAAEWDMLYDEWLAEGRKGRPRLHTLGDFLMAKQKQQHDPNNGAVSTLGTFGSALDEVLDDWHGNLDGLGSMLAAVLAGL